MAMAEDGYDTTGLPTADPNTLAVSDDVRMRHLGHLHETAKLPTIQEALPPLGGAR